MHQIVSPPDSAAARVRSVDLAKSLAILCVLLIHASSDVLTYGWAGSLRWLEGLFWGSISRGAVPLFLLCSGALLLDPRRELPVRHIWRRSIPHILLALLFWNLVYWLLALPGSGGLTLSALLRMEHAAHLYYLPVILLVYAALPVTRCLTAHAGRGILRYFLLFWLMFGVLLPTLRAFGCFDGFGSIFRQWPLPLAWSAIGYTVLGFALREHPLPQHLAVCLFAAGAAICFAGTWLLSVQAGALKTPLLEGFSPGPCLMAAGAFSLCVQAAKREPGPLDAAAQRLSRASFCIYLVHIAVLRLLIGAGLTANRFHPLLTVPALALLCGGLSWLIYALLSRLPRFRRWLI